MPNLVYCLDGTTNKYDATYPTNVVMMHKSIASTDVSGLTQHAYYDPGVGTKLGQNFIGMCFGYGLMKNVIEAYTDLCTRYELGDQIFILGFSRGAYTARSLAGFIGYIGIIDKPTSKLVEEAVGFYKNRLNNSSRHIQKLNRWRARHCTIHCANEADAEYRKSKATNPAKIPSILRIRYIGVWDTVKTLGLNERKYDWHDDKLSENVDFARHAIALDERRNKFKVTEWSNVPTLNKAANLNGREGQPYQQKYFPGNHGSVGGGGPIRGLSDEVFQWVRSGAEEAGLAFLHSDSGGLFDLSPNPLGYLDNNVGKPMNFLEKRFSKVANFGIGMFGYSDRPGPTHVDNVSHTALVRYYADETLLPEKKQYRPGSLTTLEPLLDKQSSPFSELDYRSLKEGLKSAIIDSDEEKYVRVDGCRYRVHIVKKGESLSKLALHYYGDARKWPVVFSANKASITDPDIIYVSQRILIPILIDESADANISKKTA